MSSLLPAVCVHGVCYMAARHMQVHIEHELMLACILATCWPFDHLQKHYRRVIFSILHNFLNSAF